MANLQSLPPIDCTISLIRYNHKRPSKHIPSKRLKSLSSLLRPFDDIVNAPTCAYRTIFSLILHNVHSLDNATSK